MSSTHRLSIICVNDVYSFDDCDTNGPPRGGWSRATSLIKSLKRQSSSGAENRTVLVTANGDILGGSSLLQHTQGRVAVDVINSIPVDIAVLGNHEFDYGDEVLMDRIKDSDCRWLGSNVYYSNGASASRDFFPGVHGDGAIYALGCDLKLGVFGICTKQTPKISYPSPKVTFDEDVISVARRVSKRLRFQGANIIIAITHISEAEDIALAKDNEAGVDLVVGGHEHEPLALMVHRSENIETQNGSVGVDLKHNQGGVLCFKCGMNANWVGVVDLDIEYRFCSKDTAKSDEQQTYVTTVSTSYAMHSVSSQTSEDPTISQIVQKHRRITEESMLIASFGKDIASHVKIDDVLATIEMSKESSSLPLDTRMSSVRRREATGSNLVADAMLWMLMSNIQASKEDVCSLPKLAMINGGFIRADRLYQPGSNFTVRHLLKELPFPRGMAVLKLKGRHLKDAIKQQLKGSSYGPTGKTTVYCFQ